MVGVPAQEDEQTRLSGARAEFAAGLPRRLEMLREALRQLGESRGDPERLQGVVRRVHALCSSARVLGFASASEALSEAERALSRADQSAEPSAALAEVARVLDLLPALLLGAPPAAPVGRAGAGGDTQAAHPIAVLVFGSPGLAEALGGEASPRIEIEQTEDLERARELLRMAGPNVAVLDADHPGAKELLEQIRSDPTLEPIPVAAVGSFQSPSAASAMVAAGARRVLPKPVSPETLRRTIVELQDVAPRPSQFPERVGELTIAGLADRLARVIQKGLVDALEPGGRMTRINFGDGADVLAAAWGTVARVRELAVLHSSGEVKFQASGPEGAIPMAPWSVEERRAGERSARSKRGGEGVPLRGRRFVVADDDPAVVWFLGGLLKAVGAEITEAHDGNTALEQVFECWPDVVVSDVLMPGRDGFSLCHEIKRDVLVRDTPVILLSWKEDLLQRVRELGADADGYLRKEATASTVVERVREVLRPRARVEERLSAGGEVRGRLDGLTPRLILELCCRAIPDATISIQDAVYLYEISVRKGRVRAVTRTDSQNHFQRGFPVLAGLLGVNAGRFVVRPDSSPCREDFDSPLAALLRAPVERARAALRAVAQESLPRVQKVQIDLEAVAAYLACTPAPARRVVDRLVRGSSPRDMLFGAEVSARMLESVLSDLARRGAVLRVERDDGSVSGAIENAPEGAAARPAPLASAPPAAGEEERDSTDLGWFSFQIEPTGSEAMPPVAPADSGALDGVDEPSPKVEEPEPGWGDGTGAKASALRVPAAAAAEIEATPPPEAVIAEALDQPPAPPREAVPEATPKGPTLSPDPDPAPIAAAAPSDPIPKAGSASIIAALAEAVVGARPGALGAIASDPDAPPSSAQPDTLSGLGAPRRRGSGTQPMVVPGEAMPSLGDAVADALASDTPTPLGATAAATRPVPPRPEVGGEAKPAPKPKPEEEPRQEPPARVSEPAEALDDDSVELLESLPPARPTEPKTPPLPERKAKPAPEGPASEAPSDPARAEPSETWRTIGVAVLAFIAAYGLVRLLSHALLPSEEPEPTPTPSAMVKAAFSSSAPRVSTGLPLHAEVTELEAGSDVGAGNGLIEIDTGAADLLYVDGAPIGRGPRPVAAKPGQHEVKVVRDGKASLLTVRVEPGRRTRVGLKAATRPAP